LSARPTATERLLAPDAVLTRTDLAELGYPRGAIDTIFRTVPVESWPGYTRPMIRVADFLKWREEFTYRNDRVRPVRIRPDEAAR